MVVGSPMENLHSDIKLYIISRLPVESVLQSKLVCKSWRELTNGIIIKVGLLFSVRNRLDRGVQLYYAERYDEIDNIDVDKQQCSYRTLTKIDHGFIQGSYTQFVMVGSCNGLVCFVVFHHNIEDPVYICNPITGENIHLPVYTRSTNEYKVVRIYYYRDHEVGKYGREGKVQVYTIGGGSSSAGWRTIGEITNNFRAPGIFANGALHWLDYNRRCNIVAFDLADEEFRLLPPLPSYLCHARAELVLLGGNLCAYYQSSYDNRVVVWALKKNKKRKNCSDNAKEQDEYYHSRSWSVEFIIQKEGKKKAHYELVALTKNDEILLWYDGILSCYDLKTAVLKKLWDDDTAWEVQAIPHMNSLVSLKALGEMDVEAEDAIS